MGIYEAVFKRMIDCDEAWGFEIKVRFLEVEGQPELPKKLFESFKTEKTPVRSPFQLEPAIEGLQAKDKRYWPSSNTGFVFHTIDGVGLIEPDLAVASCHVKAKKLWGYGYAYTLKKTGGKWVVVTARPTWLS